MFLLLVSSSFLLGTWFGSYRAGERLVLVVASLFLLLISVFVRKNRTAFLICWLVISFLFGIWRYTFSLPVIDQYHIAFYRNNSQVVRIVGWVSEKPEEHGIKQRIIISSEGIFIGDQTENQPVRGNIQVDILKYEAIFYGDVVSIEGKLIEPPVFLDFDYKNYLEQHGIFALVQNPVVTSMNQFKGNSLLYFLYRAHETIERTIDRLFPQPESSLLAGLLLGTRRGFSQTFHEAFAVTGTSHIIALSGYNISIVVGAMQALFGSLLSRKKRLYFVGLAISIFVLFVGASPSIVRAGIMASFILLAEAVGRKRELSTSFVFTAAMMVVFNPLTLWDVGFQLSFVATAGILYLHPILNSFRSIKTLSKHVPGFILETAVLTLSAQIAVLPLIVYYFKTISLISLLTNVLILEVIPFTMFFGFLTIGVGLLSNSLGQVVALVTYFPLAYILWVIRLSAALPNAAVKLEYVPWWLVIVYYAVLMIGMMVFRTSSSKMSKL